jgi:hypothetical protein
MQDALGAATKSKGAACWFGSQCIEASSRPPFPLMKKTLDENLTRQPPQRI